MRQLEHLSVALAVVFTMTALFACSSRQARQQEGEQWHGRVYPAVGGEQFAEENSVANATMTRLPDYSVRATLTLRGGLAAGSYPWHVHVGRCGSDGPIVGNPDDYPPLVPSSTEGQDNATARFEATLEPGADYYVNVHESEEEIGNIVACGNLEIG
jgi:hypothetical protein